MKIYTRTGDGGETGLLGGSRVSKDVLRLELCGTLDELNAVLGLARAEGLPTAADESIDRIQHELFRFGAHLASPSGKVAVAPVGQSEVNRLESEIDAFDSELSPLDRFVLPGGSRGAAALHLARTVCRRAERRVVSLMRESPGGVEPAALRYLNRLSDLLFVVARLCNQAAGAPEVFWER